MEAPLLGDDFVEMRPHTVPVQQYTVVVSYFILLSIEKVQEEEGTSAQLGSSDITFTCVLIRYCTAVRLYSTVDCRRSKASVQCTRSAAVFFLRRMKTWKRSIGVIPFNKIQAPSPGCLLPSCRRTLAQDQTRV